MEWPLPPVIVTVHTVPACAGVQDQIENPVGPPADDDPVWFCGPPETPQTQVSDSPGTRPV